MDQDNQDKTIKAAEEKLESQFDAVQEQRIGIVEGVLCEVMAETVSVKDAAEKIVLLINTIEYQTARIMAEQNQKAN